MKASISLSRIKSIVRIEFDKDIPAFPGPSNPFAFFRNSRIMFSREDGISEYAKTMAEFNAGNLPIEFSKNATEVYQEFLEHLLVLNGFIGIRLSERYYLESEIGRLFNPIVIGKQIATIVKNHFYGDESLEFESDQLANQSLSKNGNRIIIS